MKFIVILKVYFVLNMLISQLNPRRMRRIKKRNMTLDVLYSIKNKIDDIHKLCNGIDEHIRHFFINFDIIFNKNLKYLIDHNVLLVDDDGEYSEINPTDYDKNFKI
jgi:hypothetical protein